VAAVVRALIEVQQFAGRKYCLWNARQECARQHHPTFQRLDGECSGVSQRLPRDMKRIKRPGLRGESVADCKTRSKRRGCWNLSGDAAFRVAWASCPWVAVFHDFR